MKLVDKKYLHCVWDDELVHERVFVGDFAPELLNDLENDVEIYQRIREVVGMSDYPNSSPFATRHPDTGERSTYRFVYHDPLYDYKKAYLNHIPVAYKTDSIDQWLNVKDGHDWDNPSYEYCLPRMKALVTEQQLAMWCAKGNGQWRYEGEGLAHSYHTVEVGIANDTVCDRVKVRRWNDTEWHDATVDYCFPYRKEAD